MVDPETIVVPQKVNVVDVLISTTTYEEVATLCVQWAQRRKFAPPVRAQYVCVTSVHGVVTAQQDRELQTIINNADIATPDGMPIVWAARSFGHKRQQRVYGPTLMLEICRSAANGGLGIFLYGGHDHIIETLKSRLLALAPSLRIVGSYIPPFRPLTREENRGVEESIRQSGADIVFVGISTPKQEKWMYAHRFSFPGVTMVGVGAAFDFHAGRTRQAPSWMQRNGLEWFFRLLMEPGRLWRRYLLITPRFLPRWAMQWLRYASNFRSLPQ